MKVQKPALLTALSLGALIAGCGGNGTGRVPNITCALPAGTSVSLIYPIPGATQVPDTLTNVVLALNTPLPSAWQVLLLNSSRSFSGQGLQIGAPSPMPTPSAPVPFGATLQFDTFLNTGGLASNSSYQVALNNSNSNCNTYPVVGSFTSQ